MFSSLSKYPLLWSVAGLFAVVLFFGVKVGIFALIVGLVILALYKMGTQVEPPKSGTDSGGPEAA